MDLKEVYTALERHCTTIEKECRMDVSVGSPEIIPDYVLTKWLVMNYMFLVDFKKDGSLIMGEVGGIIPETDGKRVLAIADASVEKAICGFIAIKETEKTGDEEYIGDAESVIQRKIKNRNGIIIVDGNRNFANYDFVTRVGIEKIEEIAGCSPYAVFNGEGIRVVSNKCLKNEHYNFNIPLNQQIFDKLKKCKSNETQKKMMKSELTSIIPKNFIVGIHFVCEPRRLMMFPLVSQECADANKDLLEEKCMQSNNSKIYEIGRSLPDGRWGITDIKI